MPFSLLVVLALLQGLTEFLPVSSSAHLELLHKYVGETNADLQLDIAVHVGTLAAVMLYFRRDVAMALAGLGQILKGRLTTYESHLALSLIVATVPVVVAGLILHLTGLTEVLRSLAVIGWAMILFGILLWWMDRNAAQGKAAREWTLKDAIVMGLWQALALIPGTSRSGAAITGGLAQGYERGAAARLAMLMSIPTIAASGLLLSVDLLRSGDLALGVEAAMAAALAFVAGLMALALMMRLLRTVSYTPYVIYRVALGLVLLVIAYG
ncbi:undecaprenyl-diphosphate phosphatase [Oceanibium sediminis]|uniref:undecaprenyl-diphosphate phosphatase n=1 Tax=Oceanibium sediminis TaxID=2026339 RepID=UPI000DD39BF5|nr:undecaprenyl-diphosphate phosphatase [Oceanibium sediminis]